MSSEGNEASGMKKGDVGSALLPVFYGAELRLLYLDSQLATYTIFTYLPSNALISNSNFEQSQRGTRMRQGTTNPQK